MSSAAIRITDGEGGQINVVCEYHPGYDPEIPSHLVVAQLQAHLAAELMRGAQSSDPVNLDAETMAALQRDFPGGDWTIEQATEYQKRHGAAVSVALVMPEPSRARKSAISAAAASALPS